MNDDVTLKPCYSFRHLINDSWLRVLSCYCSSQDHTSYLITTLSTLLLWVSWKYTQWMTRKWWILSVRHVVDQGVDNLKIYSGNFSSCTLWYIQTDGFLKLCHFEKCGFQSSNQNYAVIMDYTNLSIFWSCHFLSNSGAIISENPTESEDINVHLFIENTSFRSNYNGALAISNVNLTVNKSQFINNNQKLELNGVSRSFLNIMLSHHSLEKVGQFFSGLILWEWT